MSVASTATPGRYEHLDALRGLAAFLVLWMHGSETFVRGLESNLATLLFFEVPNTLKFGRIGVVIFFALSGYLIARSMEGKNAKIGFPIKRFFRLYPIYLFSMLLALLVLGRDFEPWNVLANLTMLPTFFGHKELMGLYWTLQTEVIFYGVFYGLSVMGVLRSRTSLFAVSAIFATLFLLENVFIDRAILESLPLMVKKLPQHLGIMFWGAFMYRCNKKEQLSWMSILLIGYLLIPSMVALFEYAVLDKFAKPPVALSYIFALSVVFLVFRSQWILPRLSGFGRISYSVYLNHGIVLPLMLRFGLSFGFFGNMLFLFVVTTAVSWVTFKCIEMPAIRLSRALVAKWT